MRDGSFLTELARDFPDVPALGVDPYAPLAESTGPVTFEQSSAVAHLRSVDAATTTRRLFVAAFLLQEILEQEGRGVVIEIVRHAVSNGSCLAVVEVDHRPADPAVMRHGLGLAYYNAYYLLHELTEQRLEAREFWSDTFAEAGATVVSQYTVDPRVDSTGLEFGCLLTGS